MITKILLKAAHQNNRDILNGCQEMYLKGWNIEEKQYRHPKTQIADQIRTYLYNQQAMTSYCLFTQKICRLICTFLDTSKEKNISLINPSPCSWHMQKPKEHYPLSLPESIERIFSYSRTKCAKTSSDGLH